MTDYAVQQDRLRWFNNQKELPSLFCIPPDCMILLFFLAAVALLVLSRFFADSIWFIKPAEKYSLLSAWFIFCQPSDLNWLVKRSGSVRADWVKWQKYIAGSRKKQPFYQEEAIRSPQPSPHIIPTQMLSSKSQVGTTWSNQYWFYWKQVRSQTTASVDWSAAAKLSIQLQMANS